MLNDNTSIMGQKKKDQELHNQKLNARSPKWDASRFPAILKLH